MKQYLVVLFCVLSLMSFADTYIWSAGTGSFEELSNWTLESTGVAPEVLPGPMDNVVIPAPSSVTNTVTVTSAIKVASLVLGGTGADKIILMFKNGLTTNEVTGGVLIKRGGEMTHYGPSDNAYHLNLIVGGDMTVESGGSVDGRGRGFGGSRGVSETGVIGGYGASFGSHGGRGTRKAYCYGSIRCPNLPGMGGYVGRNTNDSEGKVDYNFHRYGYGGGVIFLDVAGILKVDGDLTADAGEEYDQSQAGGSVLIKCGTLTGSGRISACASRLNGANGGGGGRIAIYQRDATALSFDGLIGTAGGSSYQRNYWYYRPKYSVSQAIYAPLQAYFNSCYAAGTIYIENKGDMSGLGALLVRGPNANNSLLLSYTDISSSVTDSQEVFGEVIVTNGARVMVRAGCTLKVARKLDTRGGQLILEDDTAFVEFVGEDDAFYYGSNTLFNFKCTIPGKKIYFGDSSKLVIPSGGNALIKGDETKSVELLPEIESSRWAMTINVDATYDISHVAVSNSNASAGVSPIAVSSRDLGGNTLWSFVDPIIPGSTNVWTGAISTDWNDGANWSLARSYVSTDAILISRDAPNFPIIDGGIHVMNSVEIEPDAKLTIKGDADLTVTNSFVSSGTLEFSHKEKLRLLSNANFEGSTVIPAFSRLYINGAGVMNVNLAGKDFYKVIVKRDSGALNLQGGFNAFEFRCLATNAVQAIVFDYSKLYKADRLYINGLYSEINEDESFLEEKRLTLSSSLPGSRWRLLVAPGKSFMTGVAISDCDASEGGEILAGVSSTGEQQNNVNFDFSSQTSLWKGMIGEYGTAINWLPSVVPTEERKVFVFAEESTTNRITNLSGNSAQIASLYMQGTDNAIAEFLSRGSVLVSGNVDINTNAILTLDAFDNLGVAPNKIGDDLRLSEGGILTHSGPASTESYKLHLSVAGDMTIDSYSKVNVTSKGHNAKTGPSVFDPFDPAASHGGIGYKGNCYGSILNPFAWGSGGSTHPNQGYPNGSGGGAVKIYVGGVLNCNGGILADGMIEYDHSGAGGSINLDVGTFSGEGTVSVAGGFVTASMKNKIGGGGRIAIYERDTPSLSSYSGKITTGMYPYAGAGTIVMAGSNSDLTGVDLLVQKDESVSFETQFPMVDDYTNESNLRRAFAKVNLLIGKNAIVSVTNKVWTAGTKVRVRDLDLKTASSKLRLNGSIIEVISSTHKNGKGWYHGSLDAAIASGAISLGSANGMPGAIVWVSTGFRISIK